MDPHLPIELQHLVIAQLWEDSDTLVVCSLVSSQWFEVARTLHFSNFKLTLCLLYPFAKDVTKYNEFKTLIQAPRSRLQPYIRHLELQGPRTNWRTPSTPKPINPYSDFSSQLLSMLPLLTGVTNLTLLAISWSKLLPDARHAIQSLSGVNSLSCDHCSTTVDDLIMLSDCFPQLRTLRIDQLKETTGGASSTLSQRSKIFRRLRILKLTDSEQSVVRLLKADLFLPSPTLTGLTLQNYDPSCWETISSILRAVAPTLTDLTLGVRSGRNRIFQTLQEIERERPDFPISLASDINLKTLSFLSPGDGDMWWIKLLLNTISDEHKLETINFSISRFSDRPPSSLEIVLLRVVKPRTRVIWECYDASFKFRRPVTVIQAMPELTKRGQLWAKYHRFQVPGGKLWNRVGSFTVTKRLEE